MPLKDRPRLVAMMPGSLLYRVEPPFGLASAELDIERQVRCLTSSSAFDVKMDPLQAQIMERLRQHVATQPGTAEDLSQAIVKGLVTGGALMALLALLKKLLDEDES